MTQGIEILGYDISGGAHVFSSDEIGDFMPSNESQPTDGLRMRNESSIIGLASDALSLTGVSLELLSFSEKTRRAYRNDRDFWL
jgi:hypothetical protein